MTSAIHSSAPSSKMPSSSPATSAELRRRGIGDAAASLEADAARFERRARLPRRGEHVVHIDARHVGSPRSAIVSGLACGQIFQRTHARARMHREDEPVGRGHDRDRRTAAAGPTVHVRDGRCERGDGLMVASVTWPKPRRRFPRACLNSRPHFRTAPAKRTVIWALERIGRGQLGRDVEYEARAQRWWLNGHEKAFSAPL